MCYVVTTPRIKKLQDAVRPYRAKSKEEDRGDLFIEGTPDYIVEYDKEIGEFYNKSAFDKNGKKTM